jgi:hypothetical protein
MECLPSLATFKCVIQRFITRIVLLNNSDANNLIISYVCEINWLWPKGYDLEIFHKEIRQLLSGIETMKVCSLLKLIERIEAQEDCSEEP